MTTQFQFDSVDLDELAVLARVLAPLLKAGDVLLLLGEIGAGKTAFARALIRTLAGDARLDVPSPAFALHQIYETPRLRVSHFDFYRLKGELEVAELGLDDVLASDLVIAEWPERAGDRLPASRLEIGFEETADPERRRLTLTGREAFAPRLARFKPMLDLLRAAGWDRAAIEPLGGDASVRLYYRLHRDGETALLMDWPRQPDGPPIRDGLPYSHIAHLAEGVTPFAAIASALRDAGIAAPRVLAQDLEAGLLLIEDFGDAVYQTMARRGDDMRPLYPLAVEALIALRFSPPPPVISCGGAVHTLPRYDAQALGIEVELLIDWYVPFVTGQPARPEQRASFIELWREQIGWLLAQGESAWVLRDYHSPNLIWRAGETGLARLGVIDFQDALIGHSAYDLVSLLQDARIDLPAGLEAEMFDAYCAATIARQPDFARAAFSRAYAVLGAQRNTKILGIFARLALRDGKRGYLQHLPRIERYVAQNLEHPALAGLKAWMARELPRTDQ